MGDCVIIGDVPVFANVNRDKEQAKKVLEEAAEVFGAWQMLDSGDWILDDLVAECADVIQATANLLAAYGVFDLEKAMVECTKKNRLKGRAYAIDEGEARGETYMDAGGEPQNPQVAGSGRRGACNFRGVKSYIRGRRHRKGRSLVNAPDTREKLEADVRKYANPSNGTGTLGACWEEKMLQFLDRQAAITEREWKVYRMRKVNLHRLIERDKRISDLEAENSDLEFENAELKNVLVQLKKESEFIKFTSE